ncbi:glycosyltransferase [Mesomycoplasma moatsii]|uniref:glycosyltransferase n=1 Tax=Mesomycoplasma moatsii TaxID=171287 RepID=UPI003872DD0C
MRKSYIKKIVKDYLEITSRAKLPSKLPKVVYVYTTHNDFMPSRLEQNIRQTYRNIEYWISDGSSNPDNSKLVEEFAKKHKINLFKMNQPSKDKSDNLNAFLNHLYSLNHDFEYIVTSDSDVAFDKNFVEVGIRYFYSEKINRLGYVNSLLIDYNSNNFYNNGMAGWETVPGFLMPILENLDNLRTPHLYGACSITKVSFLKDINNGYFFDIYEDWYTRMNGIKKMWKGLYSPLVVSQQSMEDNVFPTLKRYMRYFSWKAAFFKKNTFYRFNDEYSKSFWNELNSIIFYVFKIFINLFILSSCILLTMISIRSIMFFVFLIPIFLYKFLFWSNSFKLLKSSKTFELLCVVPFWTFAHSWECCKQWFKSVLGNKMVGFTPTRSIDKGKKKVSNWSKIKYYVLTSFLTLLVLIGLNFVMVYFNLLDWKWWEQFLIIFADVIILYVFLGNISTIILFLMSFIKVNKSYSPLDFVKFDNDYINFTAIKNDFFDKNKDIERFC